MTHAPQPLRTSIPRRGWLLAALVVVCLLGLSLAWRAARRPAPRMPQRVLLLAAELDKGSGLSPREARIITDLLEDILDVHGLRAVTRWDDLPPLHTWADDPREGLVLRLRPRRVGQRLRLDATFAALGDLRRGGTWIRHDARPLLPLDAFEDLLKFLPGPAVRPDRRILPSHPAGFWDYVGLNARIAQEGPGEALMAALEAGARLEPASAAWHLARGRVRLERALRPETRGSEDVHDAIAGFTRALELCPGYPAAVAGLARIKIESGAPREALGLLQGALRQRPDSLPVLLSVGYAARYTGLQPVAMGASERLEAVHLHPNRAFPTQVTYLYGGERERFLASLWPSPGTRWNALQDFYRGYVHLMDRHRDEALAAFRKAASDSGGDVRAVELARLFARIVEEKPDEARQLAARLAERQQHSRLPDGEVTLILAEALALLGDLEKAMDMTQQAFIQGFGSTSWYKASPFLETLRTQPRWTALEGHLAERQALLEGAFPKESWGF